MLYVYYICNVPCIQDSCDIRFSVYKFDVSDSVSGIGDMRGCLVQSSDSDSGLGGLGGLEGGVVLGKSAARSQHGELAGVLGDRFLYTNLVKSILSMDRLVCDDSPQ